MKTWPRYVFWNSFKEIEYGRVEKTQLIYLNFCEYLSAYEQTEKDHVTNQYGGESICPMIDEKANINVRVNFIFNYWWRLLFSKSIFFLLNTWIGQTFKEK